MKLVEKIPEFLLLIGCTTFGKGLGNIPIPEIQGAVGGYDKKPLTWVKAKRSNHCGHFCGCH
jgi:hypothetical protein